jgi:DhnA family fructose-bisphosphate aldolase class Ia
MPAYPYRLNRLFNAESGRALDVAVDHGFFGEPSFLTGIENMTEVIETIVQAGPDAIQLTPGQAPLLQALPGKAKPALVMRADVANVYGNPLDSHLFSVAFPDAIEQAVRLDAVAVCVNLLHLPGRPEIREACIRAIMALRAAAPAYGMPLMVEPLVMQDNAVAGGYQVDGTTSKVVTLVRQARELGADLIKADPTSDIEDYHQVVEAAGEVPVLVRGGGRVEDDELLRRTEAVLEQGARGIVYGRNVIQHPRPAALVAALMGIVHDGLSTEQASERLRAAAGSPS